MRRAQRALKRAQDQAEAAQRHCLISNENADVVETLNILQRAQRLVGHTSRKQRAPRMLQPARVVHESHKLAKRTRSAHRNAVLRRASNAAAGLRVAALAHHQEREQQQQQQQQHQQHQSSSASGSTTSRSAFKSSRSRRQGSRRKLK